MDSLPCAGNPFAALRLLGNYNQFLLPHGDLSTISGLQPAALLGTLAVLPTSARPGSYLGNNYCRQPSIGQCLLDQKSLDLRRRGEKRPIPDEQKDEKYFEKRKRNNEAAKKSRDARKIREDQIALRACVLEHENASLRAHVAALTAEVNALRELIAVTSSGSTNYTSTVLPTSTTND